jgi:hypothetical protein
MLQHAVSVVHLRRFHALADGIARDILGTHFFPGATDGFRFNASQTTATYSVFRIMAMVMSAGASTDMANFLPVLSERSLNS